MSMAYIITFALGALAGFIVTFLLVVGGKEDEMNEHDIYEHL